MMGTLTCAFFPQFPRLGGAQHVLKCFPKGRKHGEAAIFEHLIARVSAEVSNAEEADKVLEVPQLAQYGVSRTIHAYRVAGVGQGLT